MFQSPIDTCIGCIDSNTVQGNYVPSSYVIPYHDGRCNNVNNRDSVFVRYTTSILIAPGYYITNHFPFLPNNNASLISSL